MTKFAFMPMIDFDFRYDPYSYENILANERAMMSYIDRLEDDYAMSGVSWPGEYE